MDNQFNEFINLNSKYSFSKREPSTFLEDLGFISGKKYLEEKNNLKLPLNIIYKKSEFPLPKRICNVGFYSV